MIFIRFFFCETENHPSTHTMKRYVQAEALSFVDDDYASFGTEHGEYGYLDPVSHAYFSIYWGYLTVCCFLSLVLIVIILLCVVTDSIFAEL